MFASSDILPTCRMMFPEAAHYSTAVQDVFRGDRCHIRCQGVFNKETGLWSKNLFHFNLNGTRDEVPFPAQQPVAADSVIDFLLENDHLDAAVREIGRLIQPQPMDMYAGYFNYHMWVLESLVRQYEDQGKLAASYIGGPEGAGKQEVVETFAQVLKKRS